MLHIELNVNVVNYCFSQ